MNSPENSIIAVCPSCAAHLHFNRQPNLGAVVFCHECEETLQVVRQKPLRLEWYISDHDGSWASRDYRDYDDYSSRRFDRDGW